MKQQTDAYKHRIITIPNLLSGFRIALIPLIVWLYCCLREHVLAGCMLILSAVTDIVDGFIARRYHMISDLGKVLDPIADKLTQGIMLICLLIRFPGMIYPLAALLVKELFMSISGYWIIRKKKVVLGANWHGKAATCLVHCTVMLHVFWQSIPTTFSNAIIAACVIMISISLVLYALRNYRVLKSVSLQA